MSLEDCDTVIGRQSLLSAGPMGSPVKRGPQHPPGRLLVRIKQSRTALRGAAEQVPGRSPLRALSPGPFVEGTAGSCRGHPLTLESSCQAPGAPEVPLLSLEAEPPGSSWGA